MWGTRNSTNTRLAALERERPPYALVGDDHLQDLIGRLRETTVWCSQYLDPAAPQSCLRPARLAPATLSRGRHAALDDVFRSRRQDMLAQPKRETTSLARGRLLIYFPDAELTDGAAQAESREFFDVFNAPPWGTWVGYFEEKSCDRDRSAYLLAWVPSEFVPLAEAGIAVNPEECIVWLKDASVGVHEIIAALDDDLRGWLTSC
jgi:hypothetical protein